MVKPPPQLDAPRISEDGAVTALAFVSAWLASIQVLCLGSAVLGLPISQPLAVGFLFLASTAAILFARGFVPRRSDPAPRCSPSRGRRLAGTLAALAVIGGGIVWAVLWVIAWRRPVYDWDGLYYHLPALHAWMHAGHVLWVRDYPDVPFVNGYPMGVETLSFFVARLTGTGRLVDAGNLWYWPLGFLGLVVLARALDARGVWPWIAAAGLACVPLLAALSTTAYVDPAFACSTMAAFAGSALVLVNHPSRRRRTAWLWGMQLGLAVAAKGLGILLLPMLVVPTIGIGLLMRPRGQRRRFVATTAWTLVPMMLVAGFWFARNLAETGNPFFPVQLRLGSVVLFDGIDARAAVALNLPPWLRDRPPGIRTLVSWGQPDAPIRGYGSIGGLGYLWPAGGLVAIAVLWIQGVRRRRIPAVLLLLSMTSLGLLFTQPGAWWARLTLWLHALGLPCLAAALGFLLHRSQPARIRGLAGAWALALLVVGVWEAQTVVRAQWSNGRVPGQTGWLPAYVPSDSYYFAGLREMPGAAGFFRANCLARSSWSRLGVLFGGALCQPLGARRLCWVDGSRLDDDGVASLVADGVTWVVWDVVADGEVPAPLESAARESLEFQPSAGVHLVLLRLVDPASPAPTPLPSPGAGRSSAGAGSAEERSLSG